MILLFIVLPFLELYLLLQAAATFGGLNTFFIVLITGVVGAGVIKAQGKNLFFQVQKKISEGQLPTDAMIEGLMVFVGGILLILPGLLTDIVGLVLVFPLSRKLFLQIFKWYFLRQIKKGSVHVYTNINVNDFYQNTQGSPGPVRDVTPKSIEEKD